MMARDITERKEIERLKRDAFRQIEKNMEQFAILNDHIRNPLQAIVGLSLLNASDEEVTAISFHYDQPNSQAPQARVSVPLSPAA